MILGEEVLAAGGIKVLTARVQTRPQLVRPDVYFSMQVSTLSVDCSLQWRLPLAFVAGTCAGRCAGRCPSNLVDQEARLLALADVTDP